MKLLSFLDKGQPGWGARRGDEVVVLTRHWPDLAAGLQAGAQAIARAAQGDAPRLPLAGLQYLPPVTAARKILCVGLNYGRHVAETGRELPAHPSLFARFADSLVGHEAPVWRPLASAKFDFEGELAVVIGKAGRRIPAARALEHVAGYTCMAENSVRDFQKHSAQVTPGKNFACSGALGPCVVTADEIADPATLRVVTRLNGEVMQDGRVDDLIFPIPELIAYISTFTPLAPGDIIATGTPEGVGARRTPPLFMAAGDVLEVDIPGVGRLVNPVADEPAACTEENHHG
ncbi:5-carboxymethyl-2-hydroxymuconate isomerase [Bordetella petrii]|nr:5-carboxymethyl-2-hydroxymuconate isomerase [Bordetella petrii]